MIAHASRRGAVLAIILASYFMIVLDISIVITALPKIQGELHFSATGLSWVQNAYTLFFGGLLLLGARAGDILGRRRFSPLAAGIAFLLMTVANFVVAVAVPHLTRRFGNALLLAAGLATTLVGMIWLTRLSADTSYLIGVALPMVLIGAGQGATLSPLTAAGIAGVAPEDAGAASGLVNVTHQLGGSFGLGVLVVVFAVAGSAALDVRPSLAHRVAVALTGGSAMLALALVLVLALIVRPARAPKPHTR